MKRRSMFRLFLRITVLTLLAALISSMAASARSGNGRDNNPGKRSDLTSGPTYTEGGGREAPDRFRVRLRGHSFEPNPGADRQGIESGRKNVIGDRVHFFAQMDPLPRSDERDALARQGLRLLNYVGGNTYIASASVGDLSKVSTLPGVRWIGPIDAVDKIPTAIANERLGAWARSGGRINLAVTFHPDVSMDEARAVVQSFNGQVLDVSPLASIVVALFPPGRARQVAAADPVQFVDAVEPAKHAKNDSSRLASNHAVAAAAPYNDTGNGVIGLVYDAGTVLATHPDFTNRLIESNGAAVNDHSTHVAGTFAGSGANSAAKGGTPNQWAGYAPGAKIRSYGAGSGDLYDVPGGTEVDLKAAIQSVVGGSGIDLATASLGDTADLTRGCTVLGDYVNTSILLDKIVRGSINDPDGNPQKLILTFAAGNERVITAPATNAGPAICGDFSTLSSPAPAKNTITVGAINSDDRGVTTFSSWGPTNDGRLKPDISAPGCSSTRTAIVSTTSQTTGALTNGYVQKCGTSMATPAVAGTIALMIEEWRKNHADKRPIPSTVKAILASTAATAAVPDYLVTGAGNSAIMYTAQFIAGGSSVSVAYINPGAPNSPLSTTVTGNAVSVSLATNAAGAITSTADDVITSVNANGFNSVTGIRNIRAARGFGGNPSLAFGGNLGSGVVAPIAATNLGGGSTAMKGPDYRFGWGVIDVGAAVKLVNEDGKDERITVDKIEQNTTQTIEMYSDGSEDFKATLAWDDPPGTRLSASALVNDLDLRVIDPDGTVYMPFVLNPASPLSPAVRGDDALNNVEMAVGTKKAGKWRVVVTGSSVPTGPQEYSLITPPKGNSITATPAIVSEGDSGTSVATFVVALTHPDSKTQTLSYTTAGVTATSGTDYVAASGSLVFAPGETEKLVPVTIKGDIDDEPDETFQFNVSQGTDVVATSIGTIVDDDHDRTFRIAGKTDGTLASIASRSVNINDKGQVVFIGYHSATNAFGNTSIWVGDKGSPAVSVNQSWSNDPSRLFDYPTIANDGSVVVRDRVAGSPPRYFIRRWTEPLVFGEWNYSVLVRSGSGFDSMVTPTASLENDYFTFAGVSGSDATVNWGEDGGDGSWTGVQAPHPMIANDGSTVFRQVRTDGSGALDYTNAVVQVVNVYGSGTRKITCPTGQSCSHPGFTDVGWLPGISHDGKVVAWYGVKEPTSPGVSEPGIWASVPSAAGRKLIQVAGIGDAGITEFTKAGDQDGRIGVNATQEEQRGVTVAFTATVNGKKTLFRAQIAYVGPPDAPTDLKLIGPTPVVRVGQNVHDVGVIDDITLGNHPINNHNAGDIAFYARAGSVEAALVNESPDTPLLFVPGIAGSKLYDLANNETVWLLGQSLFTGRDAFWSKALSLRDEDQMGKDIVATDALRSVLPYIHPIYKPLFDALTGAGYKEYDLGTNGENARVCDTSQIQAAPNLFIFPYDWRRSNAVNAAYLRNYMTCIKRFYPDTKVNLLTHSMGGLLSRRTIISMPGFAENLNSFTAIAPPWLGAPKLIYVLRSGDFIPTLASGAGVKRAVSALPGAHQLMPSALGVATAGVPLYGEQGRDFDGNGIATEDYTTFDRIKSVLDKAYGRFMPGSAAASFHGTPGQDDWSGDTYSYKFYELYGRQDTNKTIGQVYETTKVRCDQSAASTPDTANANPSVTCTTSHPLLLTYTAGDGTVPIWSAARTAAMQPPGGTLDPPFTGDAEASHNDILGNPLVQDRVKEILTENDGPPDPNNVAAPNGPFAPTATHSTRQTTGALRLRSVKRVGAQQAMLKTKAVSAAAAATPAVLRTVAVYGSSALSARDNAGHSTDLTMDDNGEIVGNPIPGLDMYVLDDDARLLRSTATSPLTVTFNTTGPVEVDLTTDDGNGSVTEATRFLDVGLPDGTPVQLTNAPGSIPTLRYDSNGDGTFDAGVAVDVRLTGAAAQDTVPPTLAIDKNLAGDGMLDVTITATDASSGVASVRYSLDGETFQQYTGPFRVDPGDALVLEATAEDRAGNRAATEKIAVGAPAIQRPLADAKTAQTDEDTPVDVILGPTEDHGRTLHYAVSHQADHGSVTLSGNIAHYNPGADFNGPDSFEFTVDDGLLRSDPALVSVTISPVNDAPRVTLSGPSSAAEGSTNISYTADATDPEGDPITYTWAVTGAGSITGSGATALLRVNDGPGTVKITLTVKDPGNASRQVTKDVTVANVPPTVSGGGPRTVYWGLPLSLVGTIDDPSSADTNAGFTSRWSFGDRTPDATTRTTSHVYATAGAYPATFKATDKDGGTGTATVAVTVNKRGTSLAYTGSNGTVPYGYAKLSAKLADTVDPTSDSLANRRVTFTVGIQSYIGTTDASGVATAVLASPLAPGTYGVTARFTADTAYEASTSAPASLKVGSSIGRVVGTSLVSLTGGGRASFDVSSTDGNSVRGSLSYVDGTTNVSAVSLTPMGIAPDGRSAWFAGVTTTGIPIRVYIEDRGAGFLSDTFQFWLNGVLKNGTGALSAGEVTITKP